VACKFANKSREGVVYKEITKNIDMLLQVQSSILVYIDFPEEVLEDSSINQINSLLEIVKNNFEKLIVNYDVGKFFKGSINVAIVGKPNVGKSSLMNLMVGRQKSIVTNIAGTTRDVVEEDIIFANVNLKLADTAGIRRTKDVIEKCGIECSEKNIETSHLILAVFDNSLEFDECDKLVISKLKGKLAIAIINKIDCQCKLDISKITDHFSNVVKISVKGNDEGFNAIEIISKTVEDVLNLNKIDSSSIVLSNERQLECIKSSLKSVKNAILNIKSGVTLDILSVILEEAIEPLLNLEGKNVQDTVIEEIFSKFCVGK
jgi:tRNA modification GTPase